MNFWSSAAQSHKIRRHLLLLLFVYLILAILLTWPTAPRITTHLPGDGGDDPAIAWNLWWGKYALLNEGQNLFLTDFMFYPIGINLAFYTLTVLNAITALPLTLTLGVVTASNLHMLFTFVVGAYGTFLLVRFLLTAGKRPPAVGDGLIWISAAMAGGFYAFASNKLFYVALGQFNIASTHWIPFAILFTIRAGRHPNRWQDAVLAGLFLTFQTWTEMTYATFIVIFIGLYWLAGLTSYAADFFRRRQIASPLPHLRAGALLGMTFALGISPLLAMMIPAMLTEGYTLVEGSGFAGAFSADLLGFVIPTLHHPWLGDGVTRANIADVSKGQHIYLGIVLLGLMIVSLVTGHRYRETRFWLISALVFGLLCLGPVITFNGQSTGLPGPFVMLQQLPFFKGNRYPSRYSVMLVLSLSVLAGFALVQIGQWVGRGSSSPSKTTLRILLYIFIPLFFLAEHLSIPLPQSDMRVPPPYQVIIDDPADVTVLDIPFAWRNGFRITGALTTQFMFGQFYQTAHQKPMLQGNTSRNPAFKFQYFTNAPVINSLLALETGKTLPPERWEADQALADKVLHFFNIRYLVVRPEPDNPFGHFPQATLPYIENVLPVEKIHNSSDIIIYRADPAVQFQTELINSLNPLTHLYLGEGWGQINPGQFLTAQRREARLLLPLADADYRLTLRLQAPATRSLRLELNGWQSRPQQIHPNWQLVSFDIPSEATRGHLSDLRLHFDQVSTLPLEPPLQDVSVVSAGEDVGGFGRIFVNGHHVSPNRRGYNVAIIRPDGDIQAAAFDTHLDPAASTALTQFIKTAPADALIAVAAADEASGNLTAEAVQALHSIGASGDLRGCFRCSHAIIGFAAAETGEAKEALDALKPVNLTTGCGLTEPTIAAVIDWIQIEASEHP